MPGIDLGGDPDVNKEAEFLTSWSLKISIHMKISDLPNRRAKTFYQIFVFSPTKETKALKGTFLSISIISR